MFGRHRHRRIDNSDRVIEFLLGILEERLEAMSENIEVLTVAVANIKGVADSAIVLINGLADQIALLKDDPAALQALADELNTEAAVLAEAVATHTPTP